MEKVITALEKLGIKPDDILMVHSSLSSMGWVEDGPQTIIKALRAAVCQGTILMPSLSYRYVNKNWPRFTVFGTPSCTGAIAERFRLYPSVERSIHPTHSVCACGVDAAEITSFHVLDRTPVGPNSPFRLLAQLSGKILMLGCGLKPNTFMHGVEEAARLPYVLEEESTRIFMDSKNGSIEEVHYFMHDFKGITQRYERVAEICNIKQGKILEADAYVIDANELWNEGLKKLEEDPWFFVDRE